MLAEKMKKMKLWMLAAILVTCGTVAVVTARNNANAQNDNPAPKVESTELIRTSQSWDGVELPDYLKGRPELVAVKYVFPAGQKLGWHHHPVMNYGILVQGELTIIGQDGKEKTVHDFICSTSRRRIFPSLSSILRFPWSSILRFQQDKAEQPSYSVAPLFVYNCL